MAIKSQGSSITVDIVATPTVISDPVTIGRIGQQAPLIDVTDMSSTVREYLGGLSDGDEVGITCNYLSGDAGQEYCRDNQNSTGEAFVVTLSNSDTASFTGIVTSYGVGSFEVEGKVPVDMSVKIISAIVWA